MLPIRYFHFNLPTPSILRLGDRRMRRVRRQSRERAVRLWHSAPRSSERSIWAPICGSRAPVHWLADVVPKFSQQRRRRSRSDTSRVHPFASVGDIRFDSLRARVVPVLSARGVAGNHGSWRQAHRAASPWGLAEPGTGGRTGAQHLRIDHGLFRWGGRFRWLRCGPLARLSVGLRIAAPAATTRQCCDG